MSGLGMDIFISTFLWAIALANKVISAICRQSPCTLRWNLPEVLTFWKYELLIAVFIGSNFKQFDGMSGDTNIFQAYSLVHIHPRPYFTSLKYTNSFFTIKVLVFQYHVEMTLLRGNVYEILIGKPTLKTPWSQVPRTLTPLNLNYRCCSIRLVVSTIILNCNNVKLNENLILTPICPGLVCGKNAQHN